MKASKRAAARRDQGAAAFQPPLLAACTHAPVYSVTRTSAMKANTRMTRLAEKLEPVISDACMGRPSAFHTLVCRSGRLARPAGVGLWMEAHLSAIQTITPTAMQVRPMASHSCLRGGHGSVGNERSAGGGRQPQARRSPMQEPARPGRPGQARRTTQRRPGRPSSRCSPVPRP